MSEALLKNSGNDTRNRKSEKKIFLLSEMTHKKTEHEKFEKDMDFLANVFREIEECGRKTGKDNLAAKMYIAVTNIMVDAMAVAKHGKTH